MTPSVVGGCRGTRWGCCGDNVSPPSHLFQPLKVAAVKPSVVGKCLKTRLRTLFLVLHYIVQDMTLNLGSLRLKSLY